MHRAGWTGTRRPDSSQEQVPQLPAQEVTSPSSGDVPAAADSLRGDSLIPVASPRRDTTPSASDTLMARSIARGSASTIR
jgi:hypothetical protein